MPTETTKFDSHLKRGRLSGDLVLRSCILVAILASAAYIASLESGFSSVAFFTRVIMSVGPVIAYLGPWALLLAGLAMLLKDLEHVAPRTWDQEANNTLHPMFTIPNDGHDHRVHEVTWARIINDYPHAVETVSPDACWALLVWRSRTDVSLAGGVFDDSWDLGQRRFLSWHGNERHDQAELRDLFRENGP